MTVFHPRFRRKVLEHEPVWRRCRAVHGLDALARYAAAQHIDDHGGELVRRPPLRERTHMDAVDERRIVEGQCAGERKEHVGQVDPDRHGESVLVVQLARKSPGNARIAEVVDDPAEEVPACRHLGIIARRGGRTVQRRSV